ncbi:MAG: proline dehydrogenase family protein [Anaerolineales bacterium]|jgi:proline dehydrogenase
MLRSVLLNLSTAKWSRRFVTESRVARRVASRFVAGETFPEAIRPIRDLNARRIAATVDHLGESVATNEDAVRATEEYLGLLEAISQADVWANVSLKLSQLGQQLSRELCALNLKKILDRARQQGIFVRMDMEDSPWVDPTLELYEQMRTLGYDNVGVVIQAYLYRSQQDVEELLSKLARIRLCKGAYKEPAEIAFPNKRDVDKNYLALARRLLDASREARLPADLGRCIPPLAAIATHDERIIRAVAQYAREHDIARDQFEFQMLYGIRRDLQESLAAEGYAVRVYVPYGTEWYPYFMRRLAERPANLWFFISNFIRR